MSKCGNCRYGVMTGTNRMFCSAQNCLCEEVFDCEDYEPIVKPTNNYDLLRAKSVEEMAQFIMSIEPAACPFRDDHGDDCRFTRCENCWIDWLKQEVKE